MRRKKLILTVTMILVLTNSCDEPETVVTNFVHPDGSVTRKIEMKNSENNFKISDIQVPFDSTWIITDTIEVDENSDTTWVKRAEKLYVNVDAINMEYRMDSGANRNISRSAEFSKKFRWFNNEYRFVERIESKMSHGYPVSDFLDPEELRFYYSPEYLKYEKLSGPDSLKYKQLDDSVEKKSERWILKNFVAEWIEEFGRLTRNKTGNNMLRDTIKKREDEFISLVEEDEEKFDSLWSNGLILKEFIGEENSLKYSEEADSADGIVLNHFWIDFKDYSMRVAMPGKLTGTNGFIDSNKILLWPVKSNFFLTEPYEMWAESRIPNKWAWIVTGLFLIFVITGLIIRTLKKG